MQLWGFYCRKTWFIFHFIWNGVEGTNTKAKIITLKGVLFCAQWLSNDQINVFGDSKVAIDRALKRAKLAPLTVINWMKHIDK